MFDQIKNIYNLKKQAEELQKQMAGKTISAQSGNVTLTLNGSLELTEIKIADGVTLSHDELERDIKAAYGKAQNQMKQVLATKFKGLV